MTVRVLQIHSLKTKAYFECELLDNEQRANKHGHRGNDDGDSHREGCIDRQHVVHLLTRLQTVAHAHVPAGLVSRGILQVHQV